MCVLPVDTEAVFIYIRSSVKRQEIFPLDLELWLILSQVSKLPSPVHHYCKWFETVTKVMALVVTGDAGYCVSLVGFLASYGTTWMVVAGWMTWSLPSLFVWGLEASDFLFKSEKKLFFNSCLFYPCLPALRWVLRATIQIHFPALGFGLSIEKMSVFLVRTQHF